MERELHVLTERVAEVLEELGEGATEVALQRLIPLKHSLSAFEVQVCCLAAQNSC